jgi:peroxiredoxin Q/BCP
MAKLFDLLRLLLQRGGTTQMLQVGDPAPDFMTKTHEGNDLSLAQLRGKKVLLWFYPKADTPG